MAKRTVDFTRLIIIGGSAGSLDVLFRMLPALRDDMPYPIVIVLHRKISNDDILVELFSKKTSLKVREAEEKAVQMPGKIYIAPGDYHLLFEQNKTFSLDASEKVNYSRPSIDVTFRSAAVVYGAGLICVLLSGANADGSDGLAYVKSKGGMTVAQDPATAEVPYMPEQAILHGVVDHIIDADQLAAFLNQL